MLFFRRFSICIYTAHIVSTILHLNFIALLCSMQYVTIANGRDPQLCSRSGVIFGSGTCLDILGHSPNTPITMPLLVCWTYWIRHTTHFTYNIIYICNPKIRLDYTCRYFTSPSSLQLQPLDWLWTSSPGPIVHPVFKSPPAQTPFTWWPQETIAIPTLQQPKCDFGSGTWPAVSKHSFPVPGQTY